MALLFMDGPHWSYQQEYYKYYSWDDVNLWTYGSDIGGRRPDVNFFDIRSYLGVTSHLTLDLPNTNAIIYGSAYKDTKGSTGDASIIEFLMGDSVKATVYHGADNAWSVNIGGVTYTSPNNKFTVNVWAYLELKFKLHSSAGYIELRVDEETIINETGINTGLDTDYIDFVKWVQTGVFQSNSCFQDIYICDNSGGVNDDFLGDIKVDILRPNASGDSTDFTPSTGSNWENVKEVTIDDDTTYNESELVGDKDLYNLDSTTSTIIHGVQQFTVMRKNDVGTKGARQVLKSGSTEDVGDTKFLNDSYTGYRRPFDVNPDTTTAWTQTTLNALQTGVEVTH